MLGPPQGAGASNDSRMGTSLFPSLTAVSDSVAGGPMCNEDAEDDEEDEDDDDDL